MSRMLASTDREPLVAERGEHFREVVLAAHLNGEHDLRPAHGDIAGHPVMGHVQDVRLLRPDDAGEAVQAAGNVVDDYAGRRSGCS